MALRASSLQSTNTLAINREIGSQYDVILEVSKHLVEIDTLANEDINGLINSLNEAKDFTGITVVTGETPSWDAVNKVLTVTTEKGDTGADGRGIVGIELTSTVGLTKTYTINYTDATSSTFTVINGADGANGVAGKSVYQLWLDAGNVGTLNDFLEAMKGPKGSAGPQGIGIQGPAGADGQDLTVEQIGYNGDGTFTWQFSDGTSYTTPDLRGPRGATGQKGDKGDQGISVHHIKGTSTTNPVGDFGTVNFKDTYTLYGDANETLNLGYFTVSNGYSSGMQVEVYDADNNGIVDNSERLGGELPEYYVNTNTTQNISGDKTFANNVIVQGDLTVAGTQTTVNSETVQVKDNEIVLNSGEVNAGITAGKAGIKVDRGTLTNYEFIFDEVDDSFKIGETGSLQKVATREDAPINGGIAVWDSAEYKFVTTGILPVVRGGTGASTSTGSGSVVLSVSPTLVTPVLGVATGTSFNSITGLSSTSPNMDGVASAGTAVTVARGDHTHPTDTSRQATITGAATTITSANLSASKALVSDTNGKVAVSNVTGVELGYLSGVTSSVQTQINSKASLVSPTFTGTPVAPTASIGTNTTQIATTAYVVAEINKIEEW